jgi:TolA-binding protein
MDRALILSYLQAAEEHVADIEQDIADQRDLISTLERTGRDAASAIAVLRGMEETQRQHVADRERLRAELAVLNAGEAARADASIVTAAREPRSPKRRLRRTPFGRR